MTAHETELKALMLVTERGDAAAYRTLLAKLVPRLRAYYKRRMMGAGRGAEEAEDLVQETLKRRRLAMPPASSFFKPPFSLRACARFS